MSRAAWRAHLRSDGQPKRAFPSLATAATAATEMTERGSGVEPYLCAYCRQWHVGKWFVQPRQRWSETERWEMGERVWGYLLEENHPEPRRRRRTLRQRAHAAAKARVGARSRPEPSRHGVVLFKPSSPPLDGYRTRFNPRGPKERAK